MRLFAKSKQDGWLSLTSTADSICVAHIKRPKSAKPKVFLCESRAGSLQSDNDLQALAKDLGLSRYHCTTLLAPAEYQLLQVEAPAVPADEVKQAVRWRIKDMIEYPVDAATVDVLDIPHDAGNPNRQHFMYAVAARNEVVREHMGRFIERNKIPLEAIDVPELAQRNIASLLEEEGRGLVLLSFTSMCGLLTFTAGGELYHARQIDVTLEQMQDPDEERRTRVFERVALELQRSLDNFERQFPYVGVNRLLLAPFARQQEFCEYLKTYLYLQVGTFLLPDVLDMEGLPFDDPDDQARAFSALGAALREATA